MVLAHEQGLDVVAIGALVNRPLTSMIWLGKSGIKGVADLKGKTVATAGIPYQDAFLKTILARAKLSPDDVKAVNVGFGLLPALLSGSAQAMLGGFSNVEGVDLRERGKARSSPRSTSSASPPTTSSSWSPTARRSKPTRRSSASSSPPWSAAPTPRSKQPTRPTKALLEANPDLDPKLTEAEVEATLPLLGGPHQGQPYGYMDPAEWDDFAGWMRDNGLIESLPTAERAAQQRLPARRDPRIAERALAAAAADLARPASPRGRGGPGRSRSRGGAAPPAGPRSRRPRRSRPGQRPRHADDRLDDRRALLLDPERVDEGAVDLQRVEGEAVEVGERGVAGAEVVEDEPHAELVQRPQRGDRASPTPRPGRSR